MKAKFTWRKVKWLKETTYTLTGWSDVIAKDYLPREYVSGSGPKFWYVPPRVIDNVARIEYIRLGHDYGSYKPSMLKLSSLFEGAVLPEDQYNKVTGYLKSSGTRLSKVKKAVQDSSELLEIEV